MPQTRAGRKVQRNLSSEYGSDKGRDIYYALQVEGKGGKGKHRWEGAKPGGTLAKARRTYMTHKKVLTTKARRAIPTKDFAGPDRSYPIHDEAHARNALARVSQFGSPALQARVRAAVHRKFPNIGKSKGKSKAAKPKAVWDEAAYKRIRRKVFSLRKNI